MIENHDAVILGCWQLKKVPISKQEALEPNPFAPKILRTFNQRNQIGTIPQ